MSVENNISTISLEIHSELSDDSSLSISYIAGWLRDNVGNLNNAIGTSFNIDGTTLDLDSVITEDQKSIFKSLFYCKYYNNMANKNLGASGFDWIAIDEADSKIRRASKTDIAKVFLSIAKDCNENLNKMIFYYKNNKALPRSSSSWSSPMIQFRRVNDPQQPYSNSWPAY